MTDDDRYYLLLDELQEINGWEKCVNSLLENANTDIYVTGSNSKLMSAEISTYLTGRYVEIPVYTLSFSEYWKVVTGSFTDRTAYQIVEGIYHSVISNDITKRHRIFNPELFDRVVRYIVENVGKTFSVNAIVKFLKSERRSLSVETMSL